MLHPAIALIHARAQLARHDNAPQAAGIRTDQTNKEVYIRQELAQLHPCCRDVIMHLQCDVIARGLARFIPATGSSVNGAKMKVIEKV